MIMYTVKQVVRENKTMKEPILHGRYQTFSQSVNTASMHGFSMLSFDAHNVTIMKNAQGDRVIIQEVK